MYATCLAIFEETPYPSRLHLYGALLKYLKKQNLEQVYEMFSSEAKAKVFWTGLVEKVGCGALD